VRPGPPGSRAAQVRHRIARAAAGAWRRVREDAWLLLQRTAAATIAWLLARQLGDHPDPFFAPIAAVVSLNTALGERGLNALRLLLGVLVGILAGEITLVVLEGGYGSLAIATFAAMAAARTFGGQPIVVAQAAAGAILTVAVANGQGGADRLIDALIGAGVALVFSQLLFTPEPVRLLHRAESAVLTGMAAGLRLTARALATDDQQAADEAMNQLRDLRDRLAALSKTRAASTRVARHSLAWRGRLQPAVHEKENAGHLDLLGVSCLTLTRNVLTTDLADGRSLVETVREIAELLADLARAPGETPTRQSVVDRVPAVLRSLAGAESAPDSPMGTAVAAVRVVLGDIMLFAGVEPADALTVLREGTEDVRVTAPPRTSRLPFLSRFRNRNSDRT
jgi:Fusaric acid resistance protein-like